jgi:transposase
MTKYSAIGVDLGDRWSVACGLDDQAVVIMRQRVKSTPEEIERFFSEIQPTTVGIEAGSQSAWVRRVLEAKGHTVIVANPRKLKLISQNEKKTDHIDAELLARLVRADPALLRPIRHRGKHAQADLAVIRSRDVQVRLRTMLINHVRGTLKGFGIRVPSCSAEAFHHRAIEFIPTALSPALEPIVGHIGSVTSLIRAYDKHIEKVMASRYPAVDQLAQVGGVGILTALAFILTIEDPGRFDQPRQVGAFCGLCSRSARSCDSNPQLRISKAGNDYLRRLLVGSGHYILGPFGPPCYLRQWGLALMARGGKNAKKRAAVAVARRLSVLLLALWLSGEHYDPWKNGKPEGEHAGEEAA